MVDERSITSALNHFWASIIEKFEINPFLYQISIDLKIFSSESISENHNVVFKGVSSFCFINDKGEERFKMPEWENTELSEIYFSNQPTDHITYQDEKIDTRHFSADPNFYLEMWSSVFLIEAKEIVIDSVHYQVR
jgi:hypothetical protein